MIIADTHGSISNLSGADILIHAGDATMRGTKREVEEFDDWLGSIRSNFKHILFTPGNHDYWFESNRELKNAEVMINQGITIDGVSMWFSPYSCIFGSWAFMKPDYELRDIWRYIPDNVDIVVTHGPPCGILDLNVGYRHVGSQSLTDRIMDIRPKYHVFGHIHEAAGEVEVKGIKFINACILDEYYHRSNNPIIVEVNK